MIPFQRLFVQPLIYVIRLYQKTLSPDHGLNKHKHPFGYCKFYPSCSEYAVQALERHGLLKGLVMALWRLLRCHPWSAGGNDPVV